jgi:hypothetical protein
MWVRATISWVGLRVFLAFAGWVTSASVYGLIMAVMVTGLTALLVLVDIRVTRESLLILNLGPARRRLIRVAAVPVALFEAALLLVRGLIGAS